MPFQQGLIKPQPDIVQEKKKILKSKMSLIIEYINFSADGIVFFSYKNL